MEDRIEKLEKTTASLIEYIKDVNDTLFGVLEKISSNVNKIENDILLVNNKVDALERVLTNKIDSLDGSTHKGFGKVDIKLDDLKSEIQKINNVTGYKDMFDNMSNVQGQA